MTTKLPRIAFVPTERTRALLREISELSGQSMASLASEILDEAAPVIQGQIEALRKIASRPQEAQQYLAEYAAKATADIAQQTLAFHQPPADARTIEGKRQKRRASGGASTP